MGADLVTIVRNFYIENRNIGPNDGDVLDGCAPPGQHRLLRFDFLTHNVGDADLHIGAPPPPPPPPPPPNSIWTWSQAHGHYHLKEFNDYRLLNISDQVVIPGFKQAFCLMDVERTDANAPRATGFYTCSNQGVSVGWSDVYTSSLPCQFIIIETTEHGAAD